MNKGPITHSNARLLTVRIVKAAKKSHSSLDVSSCFWFLRPTCSLTFYSNLLTFLIWCLNVIFTFWIFDCFLISVFQSNPLASYLLP